MSSLVSAVLSSFPTSFRDGPLGHRAPRAVTTNKLTHGLISDAHRTGERIERNTSILNTENPSLVFKIDRNSNAINATFWVAVVAVLGLRVFFPATCADFKSLLRMTRCPSVSELHDSEDAAAHALERAKDWVDWAEETRAWVGMWVQ